MMTQKVRQVGNSLVVTIPKEEAEKLGIKDGDLVGVEVRKMRMTPEMAPDIRAAFERSLQRYAADYDYLAEH